MTFPPTRRLFLASATASVVVLSTRPVDAQSRRPGLGRFGHDDVVNRARELATAPFDATPPALPPGLEKLDYDAWRDIRFRPEKALPCGAFQLHAFHLGHLYRRAVRINVIRDGIARPIPPASSFFDYGRNAFDPALPADLGYAGFRLHYPLNSPAVLDELIVFLGASYFRFLGRGQSYGLSARALGIDTGLLDNNEEFPFFREFWIDAPEGPVNHVVIHGLLDSPSVTGAYRFDCYPGQESVVEVRATVFPRVAMRFPGFAPLTSMFFIGENDRHLNDRNKYDDYRTQLHDSDGLMMHLASGEWVWRPLRNPQIQEVAHFEANDIRGFGLMQRDRNFSDYQDLDLAYEIRPSYWIEPHGNWGAGRVQLIELATRTETADNIVAAWIPANPPQPGAPYSYSYRMTALLDDSRLMPAGRALHTFNAPARALGSKEQVQAGSRRFLIDFAGGDIGFLARDINAMEVVPSVSEGAILRAFIQPHPHVDGVRATIDVELAKGQSTQVRAFLRAGRRALTETWVYQWTGEMDLPPLPP